MEQGGWIKLYRSLLDSPVWTSIKVPAHGCILLTLLLMASHSTYKGHLGNQEIEVQPGQVATSIQGICNRAGMGVTKENVRGALEKFEKLGFLTQAATKTGRLITIANWGFYQGSGAGTPIGTTTDRPKDAQRTPIGSPTKQEDIKKVKKYKEGREAANACRYYQNCIGMANGKIAEEIMMWEELVEPELVCEAIDQAARQNARWQYARAILERCKDNNILTLADYLAERKSREVKAEKREKTAEELLRERGYI